MTTTDNIVPDHPDTIERPAHATPEDLAEQLFYQIEIIGQHPTSDWERFNTKLDQLRAAFPPAPTNQAPLFS